MLVTTFVDKPRGWCSLSMMILAPASCKDGRDSRSGFCTSAQVCWAPGMCTSISCQSLPVPGFAILFQRWHMGPFGPDDGGTDSEPWHWARCPLLNVAATAMPATTTKSVNVKNHDDSNHYDYFCQSRPPSQFCAPLASAGTAASAAVPLRRGAGVGAMTCGSSY